MTATGGNKKAAKKAAAQKMLDIILVSLSYVIYYICDILFCLKTF